MLSLLFILVRVIFMNIYSSMAEVRGQTETHVAKMSFLNTDDVSDDDVSDDDDDDDDMVREGG